MDRHSKLSNLLDSLNSSQKYLVFQAIQDIGLQVSFGATTWYDALKRKQSQHKGKMSKVFKLFQEFDTNEVETFLNTFSAPLATDQPPCDEKPVAKMFCTIPNVYMREIHYGAD